MSLAVGVCALQAATIPVPNASFESPATPFVDTNIDSWQKTPKPVWYVEQDGFLWDQLTGVFRIPGPDNEEHIPNADGNQAMYLFALPQAGVFQDASVGQGSAAALDANFEPGTAYQLTVGVFGGGGGMTNGASMEISLYYLDAASNQVTVAATSIVYTNAVFERRFDDYHVHVPPVKQGDPWAGRPIGVRLLSTAGPDFVGGYWDLDHVRLTALTAPALLSPGWVDGQFGFTVQGEAGQRMEILTSTNLTLPLSSWNTLGTVTNTTGTFVFLDPNAPSEWRYYQARPVP
jgi:hypothetical protein